jgi:hypothetical protein
MTAVVSKNGPFYSTGQISFSSLRNNFKEESSGPIKASELLKNTNLSNKNPIVPDATENDSISSSNNLKLSQFRNSIKYYYITQTGTDINFDIANQSWNSNLNKNIKKWMYINGTCGSNSTSNPAAVFNSTATNLTIDVSGVIYGAGGVGGTPTTISGGNGGNALSVSSPAGNNIVIFVRSTANIYGGGGGGERGSNGSPGSSGYCDTYDESVASRIYFQRCAESPNSQFECNIRGYAYHAYTTWDGCCRYRRGCAEARWGIRCFNAYGVSGGTAGTGGNGGLGRGYNNLSGSLIGANGSAGGAPNCPGGSCCGATYGTNGETGGSGGDWATAGQNTNNSGSAGQPGRAISGSNYSVEGTINSSTIKGLYQLV